MRPPISPINASGPTDSGECEWRNKFQVQAAVAITHTNSTPVLLTVPCSVIASPKATPSPRNVRSFNAGFDVLISCATLASSRRRTHHSTRVAVEAHVGGITRPRARTMGNEGCRRYGGVAEGRKWARFSPVACRARYALIEPLKLGHRSLRKSWQKEGLVAPTGIEPVLPP